MQLRLSTETNLKPFIDLFNAHSEFDSISESVLYEKFFRDPDFERSALFVAYFDEELIGFLHTVVRDVREERIGYIKLMVVHTDHRRKGVGRTLYQQFEDFARKHGAKKVRFYDAPFNYFMPGIDPRYTPALCLAWRLGFERFADTSNLLVDLNSRDWSTTEAEKKLPAGIEVRRVQTEDREALMAFIDQNFPLWRAEVSMSFESKPIAIHIALLNGEIKAFSGHNGNNTGTGWFGPMGTHPDLRGKGIGGILHHRCLQDMKDWGLAHSIIPWVGPIDFYSHYSGAVVERVFWRFEKKL